MLFEQLHRYQIKNRGKSRTWHKKYMIEMHPDELFSKPYENASTRKKKTLELIHNTCKKQSESDIKDFSIGTIARLIADDGGPSEQALRNKNGEDYRALINKWAVSPTQQQSHWLVCLYQRIKSSKEKTLCLRNKQPLRLICVL